MAQRRPLKQYDAYSYGTKLGGVSAYDLDDAMAQAKARFADPVTMVAEWHLPRIEPQTLRFRIKGRDTNGQPLAKDIEVYA